MAIKIEVEEPFKNKKPMNWLNTKFVSTQELFPQWMCADIMLSDFVKNTGDWLVRSKQSRVDIGLKFPLVKDEISNNMIPMWLMFPPEDRGSVISICESLMFDYIPDLKHHLRSKMTQQILIQMKHEIKAWESEIIYCGGREVKEELYFRLGIWHV